VGKIIAVSKDRYRASASERRIHGGATVTEFYVYRAEDKDDPSKWKIVRGYGPTPGERKTDAIRRSGFAGDVEPPPQGVWGKPRPNMSSVPSQPEIKEFFKNDFDKAGVEDADDAAVEIREAIKKAYRTEEHEDVDEALEITNRLIGGHGVESIDQEGAYVDGYYRNIIALYVNTGDPYVVQSRKPTLLYDTEIGTFFLTTWGDWHENWEHEHEQDEDEESESDDDEEAEPNGRHARANMATRYSGNITVRLTYVDRPPPGTFHDNRGGYKATVSQGREHQTIWVGEPAHLTHAVDSPAAYDDAARAAISFALDENDEWGIQILDESGVDSDDHGIRVSRKRSARSNARRRSMTFGHMPTKKEFTEAYDAALEEDGVGTYRIVFKGLDQRTADKAGFDSGSYSANELWDLVHALRNLHDQSEGVSGARASRDEEVYENAGSVASSIMETLGFEWV
jgi:hypothetical protein